MVVLLSIFGSCAEGVKTFGGFYKREVRNYHEADGDSKETEPSHDTL